MNVTPDKVLHALAGVALAVAGMMIAGPVGGIVLAAIGGIGKEIVDYFGAGTAEVDDALATILGGIATVVLVSLAGCTTVDMSYRDARFDQLTVVERHVPEKEMRDRCALYTAPGSSPMACAEWDFDAGTCTIWFSADFPPPAAVVKHERLHCQGYIRHN